MLSNQYRQKLELICRKIVLGEPVDLNEIIWAEKLAKANTTASTWLRKARRASERRDKPEGPDESLDNFLNQLDIGGLGHEANGVSRFDTIDEIVSFFRQDRPDDWRQRD